MVHDDTPDDGLGRWTWDDEIQPTGDDLERMAMGMHEHLEEHGVAPEAIASVVEFAQALTDRDSKRVVSLLASTAPGAADPGSYRTRLDAAFAGAPALKWFGEVYPHDTLGGGDVLWAHLRLGSTWTRADAGGVQIALRREEGGAWRVDCDLLDPTYRPRVDMSEWLDPIRTFGLPEDGDLGMPVYFASTWEGPVTLEMAHPGDASDRPWAAISHGRPMSDEPHVTVFTAHRFLHDRGLWQLATAEFPPDGGSSIRESRLLQEQTTLRCDQLRSHLSDADTAEIVVDGEPVAFSVLRTDHGTHAWASVGDVCILVTATGGAPIDSALAHRGDVLPFADATRAMWAATATSTQESNDHYVTDILAIQIAADAAPEAGAFLEFAIDTLCRLGRMTPAGLAAITSQRVHAVHGGEAAYEEALAGVPIAFAGWSVQPRRVPPDRCTCAVELLFEGESPLARWRTVDLVIEGGHVKLDSDLVELGSILAP